MKRATAAALAALIGTLFASPAFCAWRGLAAGDFAVAPPPAPGSPENAADFATLLKLQADRSQKDCDLAMTQKIPDFHSLFDSSGLLSAPELAAVGPFMAEISRVTDRIAGVFKKEYMRPRPYNEDPRIQPCADKPGGSMSYPSGHATDAAVDACVLGQIFPDRAGRLAAYGKYLGDLRAIVGVHHPSDVVAGQDLGGQICSRLLQEGDFQSELSGVESSLPAR